MINDLTRHGALRQQQRCVPPIVIDWVIQYGVRRPAGSGTEHVELDKPGRRDLAREIGSWTYSRLEPKLNAFVILDAYGCVITTGYRTRRRRR